MYFFREFSEINVNWKWPTQFETCNFYVTIPDKINTVAPTGKQKNMLQLEFNRGHETQSNPPLTDEFCPQFMAAEA